MSLVIAAELSTKQFWTRKVVVAGAALNILVIFSARFNGSESWKAVPGIIVNVAILLFARTPPVR